MAVAPGRPEAHGVAVDAPQRLAGLGDRDLGGALGMEPGALHAFEDPVRAGDGGDEGGEGAPAGFKEIVHAPGGVAAPQVRVVAPPGAPGHGEDEEALLPGHEGGGLGEARRGGTAAHDQALAVRIGELHHPTAAPGHLGDGLMAEVVHDLVERGGYGRQRRELLDECVAGGQRLPGEHRVPVPVDHRPAHQIPVLVGEGRHALHREGVGEVVDDVIPGHRRRHSRTSGNPGVMNPETRADPQRETVLIRAPSFRALVRNAGYNRAPSRARSSVG